MPRQPRGMHLMVKPWANAASGDAARSDPVRMFSVIFNVHLAATRSRGDGLTRGRERQAHERRQGFGSPCLQHRRTVAHGPNEKDFGGLPPSDGTPPCSTSRCAVWRKRRVPASRICASSSETAGSGRDVRPQRSAGIDQRAGHFAVAGSGTPHANESVDRPAAGQTASTDTPGKCTDNRSKS
jgi:hypothetical protein